MTTDMSNFMGSAFIYSSMLSNTLTDNFLIDLMFISMLSYLTMYCLQDCEGKK